MQFPNCKSGPTRYGNLHVQVIVTQETSHSLKTRAQVMRGDVDANDVLCVAGYRATIPRAAADIGLQAAAGDRLVPPLTQNLADFADTIG